MFFVVDVETGHTSPTYGALLTVGMVACNDKGEVLDSFYTRVEYDENQFDPDTVKWWKERPQILQDEAFAHFLSRESPRSMVVRICDFVGSNAGDEPAYFVANPAHFDYNWLDIYFRVNQVKNPFSHRALCLRSMRYGIEGGSWGASRNEMGEESKKLPPVVEPHESQKHHALHDASAESLELYNLLRYLNED